MRFAAAVLLSLSLASSALAARTEPFRPATPEELAMTDVAFAPGSPAVVLDWVRHRDDLHAWESEYVRIKVLKSSGTDAANVEIPYVRRFNAISDISARTIHPDGTIIPFEGQVYDKLLLSSAKRVVRAKTFTLPAVEAGSILEYEFVTTWRDSILISTHWEVERELPVLKETMWLQPVGPQYDYASYFIVNGLPPGKQPDYQKDHYILELEKIPAFQREAFSPPDSQIKARVDFYYSEKDVDVAGFWKKMSKKWTKEAERFIGDGKSVSAEAQKVVAGAATPDEKLRRIYERVRQIPNREAEDESSHETADVALRSANNTAADVLRNNFGSAQELDRLFVALARAAGFESSAVRVAQRDEHFFTQDVPDASQIEGEIAAVVIGSDIRYFDPGTPYLPYGLLSWENTGVMSMRLNDKPVWEKIPDQLPAAALLRRTAELTLKGDALEGQLHVSFGGQQGLTRRLAASGQQIEEEVRSWFPAGSTVTLTKLAGLRDSSDAVIADFDVSITGVASTSGTRTLLPVSLFTVTQKNPFAAESRRYPVYFHYRYRTEDEVKLQIPEGYEVESVPLPATVPLGAVGYDSSVVAKDGSLLFQRKLFVNTVMVERHAYPTARSFFTRSGAADEQTVVLKKK